MTFLHLVKYAPFEICFKRSFIHVSLNHVMHLMLFGVSDWRHHGVRYPHRLLRRTEPRLPGFPHAAAGCLVHGAYDTAAGLARGLRGVGNVHG